MRIGIGIDVHKLVVGRKLILAGVEIPHHKGLLGHSDADVITHAIEDAILGALALGDIGKLFPDSDNRYKDMSSILMLREVIQKMLSLNYEIGNIDVTVIAQKPKLSPYISDMIDVLAKNCQTIRDNISIKATTSEGMGYEGREEGITAHAVVLLKEKRG